MAGPACSDTAVLESELAVVEAQNRRLRQLCTAISDKSRNATLELAALADFMNRYSSVKEYTVLSSTPFTSQAGPGSCRRLKLTSPPAAVTTLRPVQRYPAHEFMSPGLSEEEDEGSLPLSQPAASSHRHPRPAGPHSFGSAAKRARHTGGEADDLVHVPSFISPPGMLLKSQPRHDSRASAKAAPAIRQLRIAAPRGVPTVDDATPAQRTAAAALAANNGLGAGAVLDLALAGVRSCHAPSDHPPALTLAA